MTLSPYFQSLSRQKRICPECLGHALRIEELPIPTDDMATEICDGCGYFGIIDAPPAATHHSHDQSTRIIKVDFGRESFAIRATVY